MKNKDLDLKAWMHEKAAQEWYPHLVYSILAKEGQWEAMWTSKIVLAWNIQILIWVIQITKAN
jgi:hypothetical protein